MKEVGTDPERHLTSISGLHIKKHTSPPLICAPQHMPTDSHTGTQPLVIPVSSEDSRRQEGEEPHPALSCHSSTEAMRASASPWTLADGTRLQSEPSRQALRMASQAGSHRVAVILSDRPRVQICGFEHHKKINKCYYLRPTLNQTNRHCCS
jgi:hypothetical protein